MKKLIVVTGASGAGKTTTVKAFEARMPVGVAFCYVDSIGVPSHEEMMEKYGSGEEWQRQSTAVWVKKIKKEILPEKAAILDGQIRQAFIDEACRLEGITDFLIVLFDCSDEIRNKRLVSRGHPELVNPDMLNWAKYLREESTKRGDAIIDTSTLTIEQAADMLQKFVI